MTAAKKKAPKKPATKNAARKKPSQIKAAKKAVPKKKAPSKKKANKSPARKTASSKEKRKAVGYFQSPSKITANEAKLREEEMRAHCKGRGIDLLHSYSDENVDSEAIAQGRKLKASALRFKIAPRDLKPGSKPRTVAISYPEPLSNLKNALDELISNAQVLVVHSVRAILPDNEDSVRFATDLDNVEKVAIEEVWRGARWRDDEAIARIKPAFDKQNQHRAEVENQLVRGGNPVPAPDGRVFYLDELTWFLPDDPLNARDDDICYQRRRDHIDYAIGWERDQGWRQISSRNLIRIAVERLLDIEEELHVVAGAPVTLNTGEDLLAFLAWYDERADGKSAEDILKRLRVSREWKDRVTFDDLSPQRRTRTGKRNNDWTRETEAFKIHLESIDPSKANLPMWIKKYDKSKSRRYTQDQKKKLHAALKKVLARWRREHSPEAKV